MLFLDETVCHICDEAFGIANGIPKQLVDIVHLVYNAIRIGVPIILIIIGMIDMGKAITQQKEDEIKKAQSLLVKKAITAALVFLMLSIVTLVMGVVSGDDSGSIMGCVNCLLTGKPQTTTGGTVSEGTCTAKQDGEIYVVDQNNCNTTAGFNAVVEGNACTCKK